MSDIEQRVKKIVAEQLGVNEAEVKTASSFVDDLGADSLDTVDLSSLRNPTTVTRSDEGVDGDPATGTPGSGGD